MTKITRPTKPLADVNVLDPSPDGSREIVVCFMPDPDIVVGEKKSAAVVLAFDASKSIKAMFGGGVFGGDPNYVELVGRKLGEILCDVVRSGKVSMMYWAMGPGGTEVEQIGEFDSAGCANARIEGPGRRWGTGTQMLPTLKHIVENVAAKVEWTMGVIITDGIIEDEAACINYCMQVGKKLVADKRADSLKLVLIGVGEEVDEGQLERFDDMFEGTDLADEIDIWSHGVAASMRDESDIVNVLFGELVDEESDVAPSGRVLESNGNEIKAWSDGMPAKFRFSLPKGCTSFTVDTPKGSVTQDVSEAIR
jgi:hypothetical protein